MTIPARHGAIGEGALGEAVQTQTPLDDPARRPGLSGLAPLSHQFLDLLPELCLPWQADEVESPELVILDEDLARELGFDPQGLRGAQMSLLTGNLVPPGAAPVALGYAGHQFGSYSPRLGDGRALLLGEATAADGSLVDLHLKGSGRTPFARGGDGKATIGPMLREYIISTAMMRMGVPTTRSLAVVTTRQGVYRDGMEPGAILARVAASHIRVGTFEYAARLGGQDLVRRLADYSIARHHPNATDNPNVYVGLLRSVVEAQAELIARWMTVGFIHGVMNTDNMTISGEGIDYGPCAFMEAYDPATVYSSIDHGGRYAFGNQPRIATWNLARLAETLLSLIDPEPASAVEVATEIVSGFSGEFTSRFYAQMNQKLGFADESEPATDLVDDLLSLMSAERMDWTSTFRLASDHLRNTVGTPGEPTDPNAAIEPMRSWLERWSGDLHRRGIHPRDAADRMDRINPIYIPRNYVVHEALEAAKLGDYGQTLALLDALGDPFTRRAGREQYGAVAPGGFEQTFRTFCGT